MDWQVDLGSWIYISWLMRSGGSPCFARRRGRQSRADERLGFFQDLVHVGLTAKTLGVDLIDVLGSGWPRRKPTVGRHYLQPTEWRGVAGAVQIFASDISQQAIEKARIGRYLENIAADMSAERLNRYFTRVDGRYQIN